MLDVATLSSVELTVWYGIWATEIYESTRRRGRRLV